MPKRSWIYAGLLLMAGLGIVRLVTGPRIRKGLRVLLIGDSLAVGMAPHFAALAKEAGVDFKSLAKVGTTIDYWANNAELAKLVQQFQPELVLISLGTNDEYLQGSVVPKQRAALEKLIDTLSQWTRNADYGLGAEHIVWIGPPTLPRPTSNGIRAMIEEAAGGAVSPRFYYFDSARLKIPRGPDELHPTARGYAGWAGAIWHWLS